MFHRILPGVRPAWLIPAFVVSGALALFGTILVALAPMLTPEAGPWRGIYLFTVLFTLKFPLIGLIWWTVTRRTERPDRPGVWYEDEQREIIARIRGEAAACLGSDGAPVILRHLAREAWHVADRVDDALRADAVALAVALEVRARDAMRGRPVR